MLEFVPARFNVHDRMVKNLDYRIDTYGDCEVFQKWKAYEKELLNRYANIEMRYR